MKHLLAASFLFVSSASAKFPRHATKILHVAKDQIQRRPALTHGIVGFVLFGGSDAFAQKLESSSALQLIDSSEKRNGVDKAAKDSSLLASSPLLQFDMIRFLSAGAIGAFFGGHVYPFAYKQLDLIWKGTGLLTLATKSIVEVFTVGIFANSVSMGARGVLVGKNPAEVLSHVKEEMPEVTLNDLRVWFPYNLIAFGLIPISIRPATTSLMEALWQTYISLRSNDYHKQDECKAKATTA